MRCFVNLLVESEGVAGGFRNAIALALGTRILRERGGVKTCGSFRGGGLSQSKHANGRTRHQKQTAKNRPVLHQGDLLEICCNRESLRAVLGLPIRGLRSGAFYSRSIC